MGDAERAAWEMYLIVGHGLIPAISDPNHHGPAISAALDGMVVRIKRYAPLWGADGWMLLAAARSAARLFLEGDRSELLDLLEALADRLHVLAEPPGSSPAAG